MLDSARHLRHERDNDYTIDLDDDMRLLGQIVELRPPVPFSVIVHFGIEREIYPVEVECELTFTRSAGPLVRHDG